MEILNHTHEITTWQQGVDYTFATRDTWRKCPKQGGRVNTSNEINTRHFSRIMGRTFPLVEIKNPVMQTVARQLEEEGKSDATINRIFSAVSTVLHHCAFDQLIPRPNQFRYRKEGESRITFFTKEQVTQLEAIASNVFMRTDLKDLIRFAAYTGMRRGEIYKIRAKDILLEEGVIHVGGVPTQTTKAKNWRKIPVHPTLYENLSQRLEGVAGSVQIFGDEWSNLDQICEAFNKCVKYLRIGEDYTFHTLRHSFATWHVTAGTDIRTIMQLMGHKRIETTLRYAKVQDKAAIAAMNNI